MTSIIKSRDPQAATARALTLSVAVSGPLTAPEPMVDPELATLRLQVEALHQQLRQREAEIAALKDEVVESVRSGEVEGRAAGRAEADARTGERLAILTEGVAAAADRFADAMTGLEQLALALAHEGLAKVVLDPEHHAPLLSGAIHKALAALEAEAVIMVSVSPEDFPDEAALVALAAAVARPSLQFAASGDLAQGGCVIRLRLGTLEIGVPHQWSRLSAALRALAEPGAGG